MNDLKGLPPIDELKKYYEMNHFEFNFEKFLRTYEHLAVNNWKNLMKKVNENYLTQKTQKPNFNTPNYNEISVNDYRKIIKQLYPDDFENKYKEFVIRTNLTNEIILDWQKKGITPILAGDVEKEVNRQLNKNSL